MGTVPLRWEALSGSDFYDPSELRLADLIDADWGGTDGLTGRSGVRRGGTAWNVTVAGSTATVKAGVGRIPNPGSPGMYVAVLNADETHTVPASESNPRYDIIVVQKSGINAVSAYVTGTAAASPSPPATPSGAELVATIHRASTGGGGTITVTDERRFIGTKIIPCTSATRPSANFQGMVLYETDTGNIMVRDKANAAWKLVWGEQTEGTFTHKGGWPADTTAGERPCKWVKSGDGLVTIQGRLQRTVSNATWNANEVIDIVEPIPAAIRPGGGHHRDLVVSSGGPVQIRIDSGDHKIYGVREAQTTFTQGTGWISLAMTYRV